ncbi:MAG TPA: segregation/condensation protein A [Candidatus Methylomirabilis sp.]|nr:segregation/condensation protein A [Candidatus Methylomirabilis sp.]
MPVTYKVDKFEGPLDLLLQLIEREELDITEVSLTKVADQFVAYVRKQQDKILPEELADFLVIAARLVYMKSRMLLPEFLDQELEEGPDLATQLRLYQQFVHASHEINRMWNRSHVSFPRERKPVRSLTAAFAPPPGVTVDILREVMQIVIDRLAPVAKIPEAALKRVITIQDKIRELGDRLRKHAKLTFANFMGRVRDKSEAVVSFLALLELVKQRVVTVEQKDMFEDIEIAAHDLDRLADLQPEFV